jgi:hypothetical protein
MIYQETQIGYIGPMNLAGMLINENNSDEALQLGDKNPNKPPKKKQKKKKKVAEDPPVKKKRRKPRVKKTA